MNSSIYASIDLLIGVFTDAWFFKITDPSILVSWIHKFMTDNHLLGFMHSGGVFRPGDEEDLGILSRTSSTPLPSPSGYWRWIMGYGGQNHLAPSCGAPLLSRLSRFLQTRLRQGLCFSLYERWHLDSSHNSHPLPKPSVYPQEYLKVHS